MIEMRYVIRNGEKVLQFKQGYIAGFDLDGVPHYDGRPTEWKDIPTVEED